MLHVADMHNSTVPRGRGCLFYLQQALYRRYHEPPITQETNDSSRQLHIIKPHLSNEEVESVVLK